MSLESSTVPRALLPTLSLFSNTAASIPSLEAVRHNWDASTAPGNDSTGLGLKRACDIILALTQTMAPLSATVWEPILFEERNALLQHTKSHSRSPALLSLLLSCMKQLQHSCIRNPQTALKIAAMAGMAGNLADRILRELVGSSVGDALHGINSATATSSSSTTAGQGDSTHSVPSAAEAAPSVGACPQPQATTGCAMLTGQGADSGTLSVGPTNSTGCIASTWLVLLGRVLYTAGAALQAAAAGAEPHPDASNTAAVGMLPTPATAISLLTEFQGYALLACAYIQSGCVVVDSRSEQQVAPCSAAVGSVLMSQQTLDVLLDAAAQHAKQLEEAACAGSPAGGATSKGLTMERQQQNENTSSMGIWQQVLGSKNGRQLPQALMDVGSLLCDAPPTKFGCNEPSCCCFDKPSELQLAVGKGTKCSGCGVARYCCVAHQRLHWKQHKPACRAIAAAARKAAK